MKRALGSLGRALRRRCPRCGGGDLFRSWFRIRPHCPSCGMAFDRGEGDWTGAVAVNLVLTQAVGLVVFGAGCLVTWPDVPWVTLMMSASGIAAVFPLGFYPYSRLVWVAIQLYFHPLEPIEEMEADLRTPPAGPA